MIRVSPRRRHAFAMSVLSITLLLSSGLTAGQLKKIFGGSDKPNYQVFKDSTGRFELEYPNKDCKFLPSGGSSLALFACSDGPTLLVEYQRLADRLTQGEIDALQGIEVSRLKEQRPNARDFKADMVESKAGRGVLIRYSMPDPEPVVGLQYSIPVSRDLYRVCGSLPEKQLAKYEPILMHMIQSFKAPANPPAAKN